MIYEFVDETTGEIHEISYRMAAVPSIGDVIIHKGRPVKRLFCGVIGEGTIAQKSKYPYLSSSMSCKNAPCELGKDPRSGKVKPIIKNAQHEREIMAEYGLVKD